MRDWLAVLEGAAHRSGGPTHRPSIPLLFLLRLLRLCESFIRPLEIQADRLGCAGQQQAVPHAILVFLIPERHQDHRFHVAGARGAAKHGVTAKVPVFALLLWRS